jgi:membrane protein YdbS with pleckstrin-like domain
VSLTDSTSVPQSTVQPGSVAPARAGSILDKLPTTLRPDSSLLKYYIAYSFVYGPAFAIALIPLYFRYVTMRYYIDAEGITMRWGLLFRREISLTYARIQDIHLSSNFIERWLGLAKIQIQTASGSASAEMTIEGLKEFEEIRDFLYSRMRGVREVPKTPARIDGPPGSGMHELTEALRAVAAEVRALREELPALLERRSGS